MATAQGAGVIYHDQQLAARTCQETETESQLSDEDQTYGQVPSTTPTPATAVGASGETGTEPSEGQVPTELAESGKSCEDLDIVECWQFEADNPEYVYDSMEEALQALADVWEVPRDSLQKDNERTAERGPCIGEGKHWRVPNPSDPNHPGSIAECPCCIDTDNGPEIQHRYRIFP